LIAASTVGAAADRVHSGQWETTIESGGRTHTMKSCVTPEEAQVMNGDESALKASIEKTVAPTGCKVAALKVSGNQVTVSSQCSIGPNTGTTTYRGDSYDSENTNGTKVHAKRIGACP
jgi:Protein of unknown function (DUF3617)